MVVDKMASWWNVLAQIFSQKISISYIVKKLKNMSKTNAATWSQFYAQYLVIYCIATFSKVKIVW
jgi:hypothetical protein